MASTIADNKTTFDWVCLLAFRWGLGSNLLGSPFKLQSKNNIYKQSCALACQRLYFCVLYCYKNDSHSLDASKFILVLYRLIGKFFVDDHSGLSTIGSVR
jgi:hypothetical protein